MSDEQPQDANAAPTPRELILRAWSLVKRSLRFWPALVGAAVIAGAAAYMVPRFFPPVYLSRTVLLYRELIQTTSLLGRDAPVESGRQRGSRLREMLLSRSNFEIIIKELNLYPDIVESHGMIEAVEEFGQRASCRVGEDTFAIQYESDDAEVVFNVTKRLANSLIEQTAKYRSEQAESTKGFLVTQQQKTKNELDQKEQALAEFLAIHPEFAQDAALAPGGGSAAGASIRAVTRKAQGLDPAIEALQRHQERLAARLEAPEEVPVGPTTTSDPVLDAAVNSAQRSVDDAKGALAAAQGRYTDKHPDVSAAKRRLDAARAALASAKQAAKTATVVTPAAPVVPVDKKALEDQLSRVNENLTNMRKLRKSGGADAQARKSSNWIVNLETEWGSLNREVAEIRDRYQEIQRRLFQASIIAKVEASGGAAQMLIIDPPYKPERPSRRGSRRVGAGAALIVMLLGALIALALAYLDDRIYDEDDLRRMSLGGITHSVPRSS